MTQLAADHSEGRHWRHQANIGKPMSVDVVRDDHPARSRKPALGLTDHPFSDFARVLAGIGLANRLDERLTPLDPSEERARAFNRAARSDRRVPAAARRRVAFA